MTVEFHSSLGHLLVILHSSSGGFRSNTHSSQTCGCIKNNVLYKISPVPVHQVSTAFKISFISAVQMTLVRKGRPLCFCARGEHPLNLFERGADATRVWKTAQGTEAEITPRSTEARNTNKRRKRRLRLRDESESAG